MLRWVPSVRSPRYFLSAGMDGLVRLWDCEFEAHELGPVVSYQGHQRGIRDVCTLSTEKFISASFDGYIREWDVESGTSCRAYSFSTSQNSASRLYVMEVFLLFRSPRLSYGNSTATTQTM